MKPAHQASGADRKQTVSHRDALAVRRAVRLIAPGTPKQLHAYIRIVLGFDIPRRLRILSTRTSRTANRATA